MRQWGLMENDLSEISSSTVTATLPGYRNEIVMLSYFGWV